MNNIEDILKNIMNLKCVSMHDNNYRCYGKGCNGSCAQFQIALMDLENLTNTNNK